MDRQEKIAEITELLLYADQAWLRRKISHNEFLLYDEFATDSIISLIARREEQLVKDARELIWFQAENFWRERVEQARKEEREEVVKKIKECNANKHLSSTRDVLIKYPDWKQLK